MRKIKRLPIAVALQATILAQPPTRLPGSHSSYVIRLRTKSCLSGAKETLPDVTIEQDIRQSHFRTAATILADML